VQEVLKVQEEQLVQTRLPGFSAELEQLVVLILSMVSLQRCQVS
jgi:hypothetical protein